MRITVNAKEHLPLQPPAASYNRVVLLGRTGFNSQLCHQRLPHTEEIQGWHFSPWLTPLIRRLFWCRFDGTSHEAEANKDKNELIYLNCY